MLFLRVRGYGGEGQCLAQSVLNISQPLLSLKMLFVLVTEEVERKGGITLIKPQVTGVGKIGNLCQAAFSISLFY